MPARKRQSRDELPAVPLERWNAFFSSLAHAESAAADHCAIVARGLRASGDDTLALQYDEFNNEELAHFRLVSDVCSSIELPTSIAERVYRGDFFDSGESILDRLASVHLVFEPSALAFLGFMRQEARNLIGDIELAERVEENFAAILRDEVHHVQSGRKVVRERWQHASDAEKESTLRSMRKHRAFLKAGLSSFFKDIPNSEAFVQPMLDRFNFFFKKATVGVFE